ncbi:MAG: zf-HC2 domain-containing protein [Anaerolineaceae bacterium]
MNEHPKTCQSLLASISDYVDGTLAESLCAELEKHLSECDDCTIVVNTLRKTVELYQTASPEEVPSDVRTRLFACLNLDEYSK